MNSGDCHRRKKERERQALQEADMSLPEANQTLASEKSPQLLQ